MKVVAYVRKSSHQELQKEAPDLFCDPRVIVKIISDEEFDMMVSQKENDFSKKTTEDRK